jgi:hypothetical protein
LEDTDLSEDTEFQPHYSIESTLPNFSLLPLRNGAPAVDVGRYQTTVQTYDPRTGAGIEMTFDVPQPNWSLGVASRGIVTKELQVLSIELPIQLHRDRITATLAPTLSASQEGVGLGLSAGFHYTVLTN